MKLPIHSTRITGWLAILMLLQGCTAAAVIRKQPDFDEENRRQLSLALQDATVTFYPAENFPVSR